MARELSTHKKLFKTSQEAKYPQNRNGTFNKPESAFLLEKILNLAYTSFIC